MEEDVVAREETEKAARVWGQEETCRRFKGERELFKPKGSRLRDLQRPEEYMI